MTDYKERAKEIAFQIQSRIIYFEKANLKPANGQIIVDEIEQALNQIRRETIEECAGLVFEDGTWSDILKLKEKAKDPGKD